jgi:two-component system, NarL family, nitrate/nitrite response regulator NarL
VSRIEASHQGASSVLWSENAQGGRPPPRWLTDFAAAPPGHGPPAPSRLFVRPPAPSQWFSSANGTERLRSVIVDDCARFVEVVSRLLVADGFEVVGAAGDRTQAHRLVADVRPDVALIDLNLGDDNGIELIADIVRTGLAVQTFLILTSTCAIDDLREIFELSVADGFLPKMELSGGAVLDILYGNGNGPRNGNGNGHGEITGDGRP